jgi:3-dehydrosphinganine reductase
MFDQKNVIITGGSSGVGKALAARILERGACGLALVARKRAPLLAVREELLKTASGTQRVEVFPCDVSDAEDVERTMREAVQTLGPPHVLINSAGILREGYFEKQTLETFREVMDINFFGTLHCIRAVLPHFKEQSGGRVVNICSMAGVMSVFGYAAYCSSKHAVAGLTGTLRVEFKPQNIHFHLVCPPEFDSPMVDEINTYRTPENRKLVSTLPTLTTDEVADSIMGGLEKNRYEIIPGRPARVARMLDRLAPSLGRKLADHQLRKCYHGPDG